jgi:hypothetical protein
MSYRDDLQALAARHDALAAEVATKTRELDATRQLLDDAKQRARLPVLPNIRVATPCSADWNAMTGDERVRACGACNKHVYNLSDMTRDEAEALILEKEGRLCVRYFQRKDGTSLLKDCTVGIAQKRKRRLFAAGAAAMLAGGGFAAYERTRPEPTAAPQIEPLMGEAMVELPEVELRRESIEPATPPDREWREVKGDVAIEPEVHVLQGGMSIDPTDLPAPLQDD